MAASAQANARLTKELKAMQKTPPEGILARPEPGNILVWHYAVDGPKETPYEGGQYIGRVRFPPEYPFAPPSILMSTPNGRFETDTRICLSMSDYHPKEWNPMWNTETILRGLVSFMAEDAVAAGTIPREKVTDDERRQLAAASKTFNRDLPGFRLLFGKELAPV